MLQSITGSTRMGCLLGSPVRHSLSPLMYNESFRLLGLDRVYLCFEITPPQLGPAVETLRSMEVFGFNLTMPDKTAVIPYLDRLSREAQLTGAVNTVVNDNGVLTGYNTDGMGYVRALEQAGVCMKDLDMTLLGAGGAAGAIAVQCALDGARNLHLVCRQGRSWGKAEALVHTINENTSCHADLTDLQEEEKTDALLADSALLVNATNAGMAPDTQQMALREDIRFPAHLFVSDIIYNPRETLLMKKAAEQGLRTMNGLYMLLYQGEAAFRLWTGQQMPVEQIREKFFAEEN